MTTQTEEEKVMRQQSRKRFENATLPALTMEEGATIQGLQETQLQKLEKGRKRALPQPLREHGPNTTLISAQ